MNARKRAYQYCRQLMREDPEISITFPHDKIQVQEKDMDFIISHQAALFLLQERNKLIIWKSDRHHLRVKQVKEYIRKQYSFDNCEATEDTLDLIIEDIISLKG